MFYCKICNYSHLKLNNYLGHVKEHSSLTTKLTCGFEHCNKSYTNFKSLRSHVIRSHSYRQNISEPMSSNINNLESNKMEVINCTVKTCTQKYYNFKKMITHLKNHIKEGIAIECCYPNCKKKYSLRQSFSGHLTRSHPNQSLASPSCSNYGDFSTSSYCEAPEINENNGPNILTLEGEDQPEDNYDLFLNNLAHFFLKLEFKFCIPASTVQYIATELFVIHEKNEKLLKKNLMNHFKTIDMPAETMQHIVDDLTENNMFRNTKNLLGTVHKRKKIYEDNFPHVKPVQIPLDTINGKKFFFTMSL